MEEFTKEQIEVLKEIANDKIRFDLIHNYDKHGNPIPYRNRYSLEPPHLCADKDGVLCEKCRKGAKTEQ